MSFKYSAIGDNTIENIEYLTRLGYQVYSKSKTNKYIVTIKSMSMDFGSIITEWAIDTFDNYSEVNAIYKKSINCIGNHQLFKAVSAITDDNDEDQWFTDGKECIFCDRQDWIDMYSVLCYGGRYNYNKNGELDKFHKATLSELQSHFQRV